MGVRRLIFQASHRAKPMMKIPMMFSNPPRNGAAIAKARRKPTAIRICTGIECLEGAGASGRLAGGSAATWTEAVGAVVGLDVVGLDVAGFGAFWAWAGW